MALKIVGWSVWSAGAIALLILPSQEVAIGGDCFAEGARRLGGGACSEAYTPPNRGGPTTSEQGAGTRATEESEDDGYRGSGRREILE